MVEDKEQVKTGQVNPNHLSGHFRGHLHGPLRGTFRGSFRAEHLKGKNLEKPTLVGGFVGTALVSGLVGHTREATHGSNFAFACSVRRPFKHLSRSLSHCARLMEEMHLNNLNCDMFRPFRSHRGLLG